MYIPNMAVFPLTISQPRNAEAWERCAELAWSRTESTDYTAERSPQLGQPMAERVAQADAHARAVLRFIISHPGCSPCNVPSCNVRVATAIDRLEDAGLIVRRYRVTLRECGVYQREYRVVALYATTNKEGEE